MVEEVHTDWIVCFEWHQERPMSGPENPLRQSLSILKKNNVKTDNWSGAQQVIYELYRCSVMKTPRKVISFLFLKIFLAVSGLSFHFLYGFEEQKF